MDHLHTSTAESLLKQTLQEGHSLPFQVISNSMSPLLYKGDTVTTREAPVENLTPGELIVYRSETEICIHRFLRYRDDGSLCLKADNNFSPDDPVLKDRVIAKAVSIKRESLTINLNSRKHKIINTIFTQLSFWEMDLKNSLCVTKTLNRISFFIRQLFLFIFNPAFFFLGLKDKDIYKDELKLLLLASKQNLDNTEKKRLQDLVNADLNWDYILKEAARQRLGALLYQNLKDFSELDKYSHDFMFNLYEQYKNDNQKLLAELQVILKRLNEANIEVIILKGAALCQTIYSDIALRPMWDVDILAHREDWPYTNGVLHERGFKSGYDLGQLDKLSSVVADRHLDYINSEGIQVEIKFYLFNFEFLSPNYQNIWLDKTPIEIDGIDSFTLSLEDHLIFLLANLVRHNYQKISGFLDIHEFISSHQDKIDWQKACKIAKDVKLIPASYYGLLFTRRLFNTPVDKKTLKDLKPNYLQRKLFTLFYRFEEIAHLHPEPLTWRISYEFRLLLGGKLSLYPKDICRLVRWVAKTLHPCEEYIRYRYQTKDKNETNAYYSHRAHEVFTIIRMISSLLLKRLIGF